MFNMISNKSLLCLFLFCIVVSFSNQVSPNSIETKDVKELIRKVRSVTFLITVNDTWDEKGCIKTVKTPPITPGKKSQPISVGTCDRGPLEFTIKQSNNSKSLMSVNLVFHSSVIEDADPPICNISWNGTYLVPTKWTHELPSLLPGCFTTDSREGSYLTAYWFYLIDWMFD